MILTLTIDTHPHTNALIEGQVKEAVEAVLRARRLGVVVGTLKAVDLAYVADRLREAIANMPTTDGAETAVQEALEELKNF
jgi:hypothetical protein